MSIFKDQTLLTITLDTALTDLTDATTLRIYYKKPSGTESFWAANLSGTQKMTYSIQANDLDEVGEWRLQAYADYSGNIGRGDIILMVVEERLTVA